MLLRNLFVMGMMAISVGQSWGLGIIMELLKKLLGIDIKTQIKPNARISALSARTTSSDECDVEDIFQRACRYNEGLQNRKYIEGKQALRTYRKNYEAEFLQWPFGIATAIWYSQCSDETYGEDFEDVNLEAYEAYKNCKDFTKPPKCNEKDKYRTYDGSCNNLERPRWGATFNCYQRFLEANYVNGSYPRQSEECGALPNERTISLRVHPQRDRPSSTANTLFGSGLQFLTHDLVLTADSISRESKTLECCRNEVKHLQCSPIYVPKNDRFYSKYNVTCLNFVRSALCPNCKMGDRVLMSQVDGYINGSPVYGNSEAVATNLRNRANPGSLKSQHTEYGELLPFCEGSKSTGQDKCKCFKAGDLRVNQNPILTAYHILFLREHNRIANELRKMCPKWNDEKTYQETRRIIGAMCQKIAYDESLPLLLGSECTKRHKLSVLKEGYTTYNDKRDSTIWIEFTSAAFRIYHGLATTHIANDWPTKSNPTLLRNSYNDPSYLCKGQLDTLFEKACKTPSQSPDPYVQEDVSDFLLKAHNLSYGSDLTAIDIHRGRDHGLPTYCQMVEFCSDGETTIENWDDLIEYELMDEKSVNDLRNMYCSVGDIDLFSGLMCEIPEYKSFAGPTACCIIGIQFSAIKTGDRFYFEHANQTGSFTKEQLKALRKVTLSGLICCNTKTESITTKAMELPTKTNPITSCDKIPKFDLTAWKDCH